ncbi:MAG: hypothetical protein C6W57_03580 [Caldibacillus debilis]|nr:MAG: hypothetical protein C6W57_03580 [Caldibacillus debilis]
MSKIRALFAGHRYRDRIGHPAAKLKRTSRSEKHGRNREAKTARMPRERVQIFGTLQQVRGKVP